MARIEPIEEDLAAPLRLRSLIYFAESEGGPDARMVRIQGRSEVGLAMLEAWRTALFGGILPHRLEELVRIRMSILEECGYCSSVRTNLGRAQGINDDLLRELPRYRESEFFSRKEKAALGYADRFKADRLDREISLELEEIFSQEEIVELGLFCGFMLQGRFAKSLAVVSWNEACTVNPALAGAGSTV